MEAGNDFYLQEAGEKDCDLLFKWVNDPDVRRNAFQTAPIPYEDHVKWFHKVLEDDTVRQYILYQKKIPVGQIRLNMADGIGLIDYSIAPDMRGQGLGSLMLTLLKENLLRENRLKEKPFEKITIVTKLVGQVKFENIASIKAFERCGYESTMKEGYLEFVLNLE